MTSLIWSRGKRLMKGRIWTLPASTRSMAGVYSSGRQPQLPKIVASKAIRLPRRTWILSMVKPMKPTVPAKVSSS